MGGEMFRTAILRLGSHGRVVIPIEIRKTLNLQEGDYIGLLVVNKGVDPIEVAKDLYGVITEIKTKIIEE